MKKEKIKEEKRNKSDYTAKDIYVLEGLDPVRKRPGMYIGSTGIDGLHHLIWEVVDNSVDEAMAGYAKNISIALLPGNLARVVDDGRGIPVETHKQTKKSALETVMTTLHAGGKFGGESYKIAGGLHGVGVSVVNALSRWLEVKVCRDGALWMQEYVRGKAKAPVKKIGKCGGTGTAVTFDPDPEIFSAKGGSASGGKEMPKFDWQRILNRMREQAYLTKNLKITITDEREKETSRHLSYSFYFEGGVKSYVRHLDRELAASHENIFYVLKEHESLLVEIALQYVDDIQSREVSFANNINTPDGGAHLTGFRTALTRVLNDYARKNNYLKADDENLTGDDVRDGLTAVISVKLREPQFEGQTKAKLGNPEARSAVEIVFGEALAEFLEEHPSDAKAILDKVILSMKARKAAKAAKETVLRKGILEGLALPGKLADCQTRNPEESELFLVEGDSAGGCFDGDTKIALTDGRNLTFKELMEEDKDGKKNYCYTILENGRIGIGLIKHPRKTKSNVEVIKIILDNNEEIICTPDHKFMLRDGNYKEALNLVKEDSLMPFRRKLSRIGGHITINGYEMIFEPSVNYWIFTHLLADKHNLENSVYKESDGEHRHHIDFNKLNNNPDNLARLGKKEHIALHSEMADRILRRPDVMEKSKKARQTTEFRKKMRKIMTHPEMKAMLSWRAKKQWENEFYKQYMREKFLEFFETNHKYRKENKERLNTEQKTYWALDKNRKAQSERTKLFFEKYPERKEMLSCFAKNQWQNLDLRRWRSEMTKKQWTPEFREKRKKAYNQTYLRKSLEVFYNIYLKNKSISEEEYNQIRKQKNDRNLVRYETIVHRFFNDDEKRFKEAVINYNHRIKSIISLKKKIDVYDIEIPETHNFALASGVFVHNSAKSARDRRTQAILPLRGKILNVERARLDKMLANQEIKALIIALGAAIAEDLNISRLRYHKIILMTDADVDGAHIRTLLLTLFYRYFQPIIQSGFLYIAQPPLYRVQKGKTVRYAYNEEEKIKILKDKIFEGAMIQRYKGLGEMNPGQLWETTMDPATRLLKRVSIEDAEETNRTFDILMGSVVEPRKVFIQTHAKTVQNLDI